MTDEIEVGAAGETLRLWVAREGVRSAEQLLAAQERSLTGMQARTTAILGWSSASALILSAWIVQIPDRLWLFPAAIALLSCASVCVYALWPRDWYWAGYEFSRLKGIDHQTELEHLESIALAYEGVGEINQAGLRRFSMRLRAAWCLLLSAAPLAVLGAALAHFFL